MRLSFESDSTVVYLSKIVNRYNSSYQGGFIWYSTTNNFQRKFRCLVTFTYTPNTNMCSPSSLMTLFPSGLETEQSQVRSSRALPKYGTHSEEKPSPHFGAHLIHDLRHPPAPPRDHATGRSQSGYACAQLAIQLSVQYEVTYFSPVEIPLQEASFPRDPISRSPSVDRTVWRQLFWVVTIMVHNNLDFPISDIGHEESSVFHFSSTPSYIGAFRRAVRCSSSCASLIPLFVCQLDYYHDTTWDRSLYRE